MNRCESMKFKKRLPVLTVPQNVVPVDPPPLGSLFFGTPIKSGRPMSPTLCLVTSTKFCLFRTSLQSFFSGHSGFPCHSNGSQPHCWYCASMLVEANTKPFLSQFCLMSGGWAALPRGATGLSAVCDCGISWSYSLTIFITRHLACGAFRKPKLPVLCGFKAV